MTKEEELVAYFNEHIFYELMMMRYSIDLLKLDIEVLPWNALFGTFNVSARNLYGFLRDEGESDTVRLRDYAEYTSYVKQKSPPISGPIKQLNAQCLHLGKQRIPTAPGRVTREKLVFVNDWIEHEFAKLMAGFTGDFRKSLQPWRGDPKNLVTIVNRGETGSVGLAASVQTTSIAHNMTIQIVGPVGPAEPPWPFKKR